jgi:nucleolar protein 16
MVNPRQRRKVRSSHKPVHHSRQAKKLLKKQPRALGFFLEMSALPTLILIFDTHQAIRGPKALQEAWDKHKTVRQK